MNQGYTQHPEGTANPFTLPCDPDPPDGILTKPPLCEPLPYGALVRTVGENTIGLEDGIPRLQMIRGAGHQGITVQYQFEQQVPSPLWHSVRAQRHHVDITYSVCVVQVPEYFIQRRGPHGGQVEAPARAQGVERLEGEGCGLKAGRDIVRPQPDRLARGPVRNGCNPCSACRQP